MHILVCSKKNVGNKYSPYRKGSRFGGGLKTSFPVESDVISALNMRTADQPHAVSIINHIELNLFFLSCVQEGEYWLEMFKRKNKTKQEILRIKGEQQENQPPNVASSNGDVVDGFDPQGFVDLTSEEHQPKLLGPQQNCKYVGTFPVSLGSSSDGETTLITHKERTKFVKKKLREYRYAEKGVKVSLLISKDGIKVITPDAQRVRMAHALQRISFATCDPEFRLFAYMSHNPSPLGTAIHCHVFMTRDTRQVQSLTAMVGKAFQVAFAESKFPQGAELKMDPIQRTSLEDRVVQGRRWARLEAEQGHEHSQHAIMARIKKEQEKEKNKSPNRSREEVIPKESSVITSSKTQEAPLGRQRSFGKARTPPQARRPDVLQQKNNVSAEATRQKTKLSDNVVADGAFDSSTVADALAHGKAIGNVTEGQAVAEKKLNHETNELHAQRDVPRPFSSVSSSEQDCPQTEPLPPTPPPKRNTRLEAASSPESLMMSPLAKSASDPNLLNSHSDRKHVRVSRHNSHEDENWYLPGIPREFVTEMLQQAEEGSFFVRDSHSKPGCFALTMRVPREANPSGFANFLIVKVKDGVMIQGFDKVLKDVTSLVEHYSQHADELPCKLMIGRSNVLCENDDYVNMVPDDPDYQMLSDFTSMMEELN